MSVLKEDTNKLMELFEKNWALVTAGSIGTIIVVLLVGGVWAIFGGIPDRVIKWQRCIFIRPAIPVNF